MSGCLALEVEVDGAAAGGGLISVGGLAKFCGSEKRREESERRKAIVTISYTSEEHKSVSE